MSADVRRGQCVDAEVRYVLKVGRLRDDADVLQALLPGRRANGKLQLFPAKPCDARSSVADANSIVFWSGSVLMTGGCLNDRCAKPDSAARCNGHAGRSINGGVQQTVSLSHTSRDERWSDDSAINP